MKNYVGRKVRGFRFKNVKDVVVWTSSMKKHIGEVGEIIGETEELVRVQFTSDTWYYPISLIEPHLIEEDKVHGFCNTPEEKCNLNYCDNNGCQNRKRVNVDESPEIPQLGEGVLMQVSDDGKHWFNYNVIAKLANGKFIDSDEVVWKHARPIPQLPKYTHAELVEKLGHDFEII